MSTYPCENCGLPIEVRPRELAIVCRECGYEQRLSRIEPTTEPVVHQPRSAPPVGTQAPLKPLAPKPSGVRIDNDGYRLRIRRRWFGFIYIPLLFFCIAGDSFLFLVQPGLRRSQRALDHGRVSDFPCGDWRGINLRRAGRAAQHDHHFRSIRKS